MARTLASVQVIGAPAGDGRARATASIAVLRSSPTTAPWAPTCAAARRAPTPVAHAGPSLCGGQAGHDPGATGDIKQPLPGLQRSAADQIGCPHAGDRWDEIAFIE